MNIILKPAPHFKFSLSRKIALVILPVILCTTLLYALWIAQQEERLNVDRTLKMMKVQVEGFMTNHLDSRYQLLERSGLESIPAYIERYQSEAFERMQKDAGDLGGEALLVARNGDVHYSSLPATQSLHRMIGQGLSASSHGASGPVCGPLSDGKKFDYLYCRAEFVPWDLSMFFLIERDMIYTEFEKNRLFFFLISCAVALMVALILALTINMLVVKRLRMILHGILQIQQGDLDYRIGVLPEDEIGQVAYEFDHMAARLQTELDLKDSALVQLQNANQELESFSYSVSHDLRAPLRSMGGFSEILLEDYADSLDAEGQGYLQRIYQSSNRMGGLIDDLLRLSQVGLATLTLEEELDLSALAHSVWQEDLPNSEHKKKVNLSVAPGLKTTADAGLLRIVLNNLMGNALKYTRDTVAPTIEFGALLHAENPTYFIRDNGTGFDPRYMDQIFLPFKRLHNSASFEGSGIGLAIVQRIIHKHYGRLGAESAAGRGAQFTFTLFSEERERDRV